MQVIHQVNYFHFDKYVEEKAHRQYHDFSIIDKAYTIDIIYAIICYKIFYHTVNK